eukprot:TRINITY_DN602_c0_g1_i1.p1 TRINITY_DN602_c0_g1~~TRINITY_DN602_c0_g1_i1.p1  ORF type:complete len:226 (+),score=22.90 TRINITY_DN602_c0_g1_i1:130-807(+)
MTSVWLYVPNLIGYSRIVFAALSFYFIDDYLLFFVFYSLSAWMDIADGHAARAYNQCSKFGAVLDMVTDRAATSCLIVVLAMFWPKYLLFWLFMIALDIMSHFAHIYSTLMSGAKTHKTSKNFFLRLYYHNRLVLGFLCFGNEGFFVMCYVLHFLSGPLISLGPFSSIGERFFGGPEIGLFHAITFFFFMPIMAVKQFMNLVQLRTAAQDIVALDELELASTKQK